MKMDSQALDFLAKHRVCSLAITLENGAPHVSVMHYSHKAKPLEVYFMTENTSLKVEALINGRTVKASFATGFSEEEWITLQMDGEIKAVWDKKELAKIHKIHFAKHPEPEKYKNDPATLFLVFKPLWWRYTEYKPKFVVLTENEPNR